MGENKGLQYENDVRQILIAKGLLPDFMIDKPSSHDAGFIHNKKVYFLEIKNKTAPDYGAKKIIYNPTTKAWEWNEIDLMSVVFDKIGVLNKIKQFEPRKHVKPDSLITKPDKEYDQTQFEGTIPLNEATCANCLYEYYAQKNCFYIQIENKGFYHLLDDPAGLNVPKFTPVVSLRLRAKTHTSAPDYNYSFRVVIQASRRTIPFSTQDIEEKTGRNFPSIIK
jgi:hypothetical protein